MNIIIVGCGKVGTALAVQLTQEGHSITVVDTIEEKVDKLQEALDVMKVCGNGASINVLMDANVDKADVLIAVTGSDELNLLCCTFAKKTGHCYTIARVRKPVYSRELDFLQQQLQISSIVNPELLAAKEISRLLQFPAASKIDSFADDRVRLIKFEITEKQKLAGERLADISARLGKDFLACAVERKTDVVIPTGDFRLQIGDTVTVLVPSNQSASLFAKLHMPTHSVRTAAIVGGGTIGYYLAQDLIRHNIRFKLVENDANRCSELSSVMSKSEILHGDGTDREFITQNGLLLADAFVPLTGIDEENVLLALYVKKHTDAKLVTKINRLEFDDILDSMQLGSIVYPKYLVCDYIVQHIRALQNRAGNNVKTLYRILDDRVEALEFTVNEESAVTNVPIAKLPLRSNLLVCCIIRGKEIIVPRGDDRIQLGDTVIVVTLQQGLHDLGDILA